jgi:hypothetical protein
MSKFSSAIRKPGWILGFATIGGIIWAANGLINSATDSNVYVINCEKLQYRSSQITGACGDDGIGVTKIHWDIWNKKKAEGKALFYMNNCDPDCADGKTVETEVSVALSKLETIQGKLTYTQLKITNRVKQNLPGHNSRFVYWNLNEL